MANVTPIPLQNPEGPSLAAIRRTMSVPCNTVAATATKQQEDLCPVTLEVQTTVRGWCHMYRLCLNQLLVIEHITVRHCVKWHDLYDSQSLHALTNNVHRHPNGYT